MANAQNNLEVSAEQLENALSSVRDFHAGMAQIYQQYGSQPASNSQALQEQSSFPNKMLIADVHSKGILSIESAADHFMGFAYCLTPPANIYAPLTCVRAVLESSALAAWFLDPKIDAKERVGRDFAFRYVGFEQQIKICRINNEQTKIDQLEQRIIKVEQDATDLGYPQVLNSKKRRIGIAKLMPSITDLIRDALDQEFAYRLFSGVAHGHTWALLRMGLIETDGQNSVEQHTFEKHLNLSILLFTTNIAITSMARVLLYLCKLYGWNLKEVENLLDTTYTRLKYKRESRFWQNSNV
jgi:hypothetical protein